jgi:hypothetical protein
MRNAPLIFVLLALLGCDETSSSSPAPAPHPAPETRSHTQPESVEDDLPDPESLPPLTYGQRRMHDRYDAAEAIREAIVTGDLDVARAIARGLDRPVQMAHLSPSARGLRDIVPGRARALAGAETSTDVARAFAELIRGCGQCHSAASVGWAFDDPGVPEGEELPEHMRRHQWGVTRMWEGLVLADAERFDRGARALEESPLIGDDPLEAGEENPPGLGAIEARIHERARAARTARGHDMEERAAIYGDVLDGCATCHARIEALDRQEE